MRGELAAEATRIHDAEFFRARGVDLVLGTAATALDTRARVLHLADGRRLPWDRLLVATGARPRHLPVPGAELAGVMTLRTVDDARALRDALTRAERITVIGAGFIGLEVAAVARALGKEVTLVEAGAQPLGRLLPAGDVARAVADLHRSRGTIVRTSSTVTAIRGRGRVEQVVLASGERIAADLVLVAIGVTPVTGWLEGSGVALDDGVLTDASLATNVPDVYAAGDVARVFDPRLGRHVRFEHYASAQEQGAVAGRVMAGLLASPTLLASAGSDQFGVRMQILGAPSAGTTVVVRGALESGSFAAFFLNRGRVRGAFLMGRTRDLPEARRWVKTGAAVDPLRLADLSRPIVEAASDDAA